MAAGNSPLTNPQSLSNIADVALNSNAHDPLPTDFSNIPAALAQASAAIFGALNKPTALVRPTSLITSPQANGLGSAIIDWFSTHSEGQNVNTIKQQNASSTFAWAAMCCRAEANAGRVLFERGWNYADRGRLKREKPAVQGSAMEISVSRQDLVKELTATQSVVERNTTIPILSNFLIEAEGDRLNITATDLDQAIRTSTEVKVANTN